MARHDVGLILMQALIQMQDERNAHMQQMEQEQAVRALLRRLLEERQGRIACWASG